MKTKISLVAIDPGCREIGVAHFVGAELVDYGVKSLRRTNDRNTRVLSRTIQRFFEEKNPEILAIEKNNFDHVPQNKCVMMVIWTIIALARQKGLRVYEFAANTVKKEATSDGRATKRALSQVMCAQYPFLKPFRDTGKHWKDRYHQNMFDAVAVGVTFLKLSKQNKSHLYESKS